MNKKGNFLVLLTSTLIVLIFVCIFILLYDTDFKKARNDFCISKGYNKSTDYDFANSQYYRIYHIECDNDEIFWYVSYIEECIETDKFFNCIEKRGVLI